MALYRTRAVVVDAVRFEGPGTRYPAWAQAALREGVMQLRTAGGPAQFLAIATPAGTKLAEAGDWIVQGADGVIAPCTPAVFAATYEPYCDGPMT